MKHDKVCSPVEKHVFQLAAHPMKFDLSRISVTALSPDASEDEMVRSVVVEVRRRENYTKDGHKIYMLPASSTRLPLIRAPKEKTVWEKFAEEKNIKKNKKVFCKQKRKYISVKKLNESE